MILFVHFERKDNIKEATKELEEIVSNCCDRLAVRMDNLSRQIGFLVTLITDQRSNTVDVIQRKMEQMPEILGIAIAYEPEFLEKVREGKLKDFRFDHYPGLDLPEEIPKYFCPLIYRNDEGLVICNEANKGYQYSDSYLAGKYLREGAWTDPFFSRITQKLCTTFALPFYYHGEYAGVVIVFVKLDVLVKNLWDLNKKRDGILTSRFLMIDKTSHILYHSEENPWKRSGIYSIIEELNIQKYLPDLNDVLKGDLVSKHFPSYRYIGKDRIMTGNNFCWLISNAVKNESEWIFIAIFYEDDVLNPVESRLMKFFWFGMLTIFSLGILVSALLLWFIQPLEEVIRAGQEITEGNFTYRITKFQNRSDKLGLLVKFFNTSLDHLQTHLDNSVKAMIQTRKMEQELLVAQEIQKSFLPMIKSKHRREESFEICGDLLPAHYMAGDFFDFWLLDEENVVMFVGDVSGKGVPAAMIMVQARTLLRTIISKQFTTGEILTKLNELLIVNNIKCMFISLFLVIYNTKTGILHYSNAGHNPPVLLYPDGRCEYFEFAQDTLIGLMSRTVYHSSERVLPPGASICLYTDGVLDIVSPAGLPFGSDHLTQVFQELAFLDPKDLVPEIIQRLKQYSDINQKDDITLLAFKRLEDKI